MKQSRGHYKRLAEGKAALLPLTYYHFFSEYLYEMLTPVRIGKHMKKICKDT